MGRDNLYIDLSLYDTPATIRKFYDTADRFAGDNGISGIGSTDICQGYQTTLRPKFGQIERIGILPQQTACLLHKSRGIVRPEIPLPPANRSAVS